MTRKERGITKYGKRTVTLTDEGNKKIETTIWVYNNCWFINRYHEWVRCFCGANGYYTVQ